MNLAQQVISLPLAKRLKELGVKQESLFWYDDEDCVSVAGIVRMGNTFYPENLDKNYTENTVAAFTVAELGEMLPDLYCSYRGAEGSSKWLSGEIAHGDFYNVRKASPDGDTEAEARGLMLAYLIENNLMSV